MTDARLCVAIPALDVSKPTQIPKPVRIRFSYLTQECCSPDEIFKPARFDAVLSGRGRRRSRTPQSGLILVDDMGWMDLSCQGSDYFRTPHIDDLARRGTRFTDAYAACAVCSPTRAAMMTGRWPGRVGVTDWIRARFQRGGIGTPEANPTEYVASKKHKLLCPPNPYWMKHDETTLAELAQDNGYATCFIGKWHLGDPAWYPTSQGFDINIAGCDIGQPPSYFDPYSHPRYSLDGQMEPRKEGEFLTHREGERGQQIHPRASRPARRRTVFSLLLSLCSSHAHSSDRRGCG